MEQNIPSLFPEKTRWVETEFNQLFLDYFERMCQVAFRLVSDHDQAEDLASEAFWRLWSSSLPRSENIPGWLYRVTTHLAYNALRAARRRSHYEAASFTSEAPPHSQPVEELVSHREQIERVRTILSQMSQRDVQLLVLRHSGLSYKEIATALKIQPGSIGTLLNRAETHFASLFRKVDGNAS